MSIVIVDYGCGNLASVQRMISKVGGESSIAREPGAIRDASKIVLAGVGAFDQGMSHLIAGGWIPILNQVVLESSVPILGICLGMQLMCRSSDEGCLEGLGWIDAEVKRLSFPSDSPLKVPHMGWNNINVTRATKLIPQDQHGERFYFVHSYHTICKNPEDEVANVCHGRLITAALNRKNIHGVQFHPEKSHRFGMRLIKNFLDL